MRTIASLVAFLLTFSTALAAIEVEQLYSKADYDETTQTTSAEVSFVVDRPLEEVIAVMDPQSWDDCSPDYFQHHYVIDPQTGEAVANPPAAGSNWEGVTFEDVTFPFFGVDAARIRNHLWWKSQSMNDGGPVRHRYDYGLHKSVTTRFLACEQNGGVTVDDGWVIISDNGDGRWKVTGIKVINFKLDNPLMSGAVNVASPELFKSVLSKIGFDLLSCEL